MTLYWTVAREEYLDEDGLTDEALVFSITDDATGTVFATMTDFEEIVDHAEDPEIAENLADSHILDTPFQIPLIEEELRLLDWLTSHLSSREEALDVLAAWRWSCPWNDIMTDFLIDHAQMRVLKQVDGLPAVGRLQLRNGQVRAVAINTLPSEESPYDLLRVVILEETEDEDQFGEEILLLPYAVLHVDARSFLAERRH